MAETFSDKDLARLREINAELEKRTRRTKKYIDLEKEQIALKKKQIAAEKELEGIRTAERDIDKEINNLGKARKGSLLELVKSYGALNFSAAAELHTKRKMHKLEDNLLSSKKSVSNLLKEDLKNGNITRTDQSKILKIQKGITDGKIKEKDVGGKLSNMSALFKKNGADYAGILKTQAKSQKNIGGLLSSGASSLGKWVGRLGTFGAIAAVVFKAITQFAAKIDEVGKTFGFLTNQNQQFRADLISAGNEAIMIGKGLGDVLAVTAQLSSEFGISLDTAADLSTKVLDTAVATGLSNDEATKLFGTFMQIGDLTAKQAEDLIEGTAQLAAQRGIAPTAVLQDLAGSAEEIAKFTKGSGENIAEAAVQARQLGLSLQTTAKISEGLLDFQNSISAEVEASVMIGRRLNFQSARRLALEGDLAGATKEVVKQLGSEEELNKLNVLQRQSIAKSIGVSVAELNKLVRGQDKLTLSTALTGKKFEDLVGQDSLSTLTSIVNTIKSLGATLLDTFGGPVNAFLKNFADKFAGEGGIERLRARVRSIGTVLISLMNGIGQFLDLFVFGNAFKPIVAEEIFGTPTNDFRGGRGGISVMAGPAGVFRLNPMDSVIATTNPIPTNDYGPQPAGSVGMTQKVEVTGTITGTRDALMAVIETPLG